MINLKINNIIMIITIIIAGEMMTRRWSGSV